MPMYGKIFAHTFDGSLYGKPLALQAVWAYVLSKTDYNGYVELNPRQLASTIGEGELTPDSVVGVIKTLCSEDKESRSQEAKGARLRHEGGFTYYVINSQKYRSMVNEDERREYMRVSKKNSRAAKKEAAKPIPKPEPGVPPLSPEEQAEVDEAIQWLKEGPVEEDLSFPGDDD
jgi:hypothetical protein